MKTDFIENLINEKNRLLGEQSKIEQLTAAIELLLATYNETGAQQEVVVSTTNETTGQFRNQLAISRPAKYKSGYKPYYDAMEYTPTIYKKSHSYPQLVSFALLNIRKGDKFQIAEYILNVDNSLDKDKLVSGVGTICSRMYRVGILKAEKVGLRNIYSLKTKTLTDVNP